MDEEHRDAAASPVIDAEPALRALDEPSGRGGHDASLSSGRGPRLDGEGFLRAMRSDPRTADIPVVILTGHPTARRTAAELGAASYLVKPVELVDLLSAVHQAGRAPHAGP